MARHLRARHRSRGRAEEPPSGGAAHAMPQVTRAAGLAWLAALVLFIAGALVSAPGAAAQAPCDPQVQNPVVCENTKPGNPQSEWDVSGAGDPDIQGFATDISVDQGQTVRFKVDTTYAAYHLDIYRMGYYAGAGARKVATVARRATEPGPLPRRLNYDGLTDCGNWAQSASWAVPADAVSGIYFAKLVRDGGASDGSHIFFVVRDDDGSSDLLFQTQDTTWQAYNQYGGRSLYQSNTAGPGRIRPGPTRSATTAPSRPAVRRRRTRRSTPSTRWSAGWSETATTSPTSPGWIATGSGARSSSTRPSSRSATTSTGPATQRDNVEAARDAGVDLAFFSGNEIFWKTRWESSTADGSSTDHRTLVSYKETHAGAKIDPEPNIWTGTWRDVRPFNPEGAQPRERADRHDVQGQLRHLRDRGAGRRRQDAPLAQHQHRLARRRARPPR